MLYIQYDIDRFIKWSIKENKRDLVRFNQFDNTLSDLLAVGRQTNNHNEREAILLALEHLALYILSQNTEATTRQLNYRKENFTQLIEGFISIFTDSQTNISYKNFEKTQEILLNLTPHTNKMKDYYTYRNNIILACKAIFINFLNFFLFLCWDII